MTSHREEGNALFASGSYSAATESYSKAIELEKDVLACLNRAAAFLKLDRFKEAVDDCDDVLARAAAAKLEEKTLAKVRSVASMLFHAD